MKPDLWLWHEDTKEAATDEQRLWYSVLVQALVDINNGDEQARFWLQSESGRVCSYRWVCLVLEIDYAKLRQRVRANNLGRIGIDSISRVWAVKLNEKENE